MSPQLLILTESGPPKGGRGRGEQGTAVQLEACRVTRSTSLGMPKSEFTHLGTQDGEPTHLGTHGGGFTLPHSRGWAGVNSRQGPGLAEDLRPESQAPLAFLLLPPVLGSPRSLTSTG